MDQLGNLANGKSKLSFPLWLVVLVDVALINLGFGLAFLFRFGLRVPEENLQAFVGLLPIVSLLTVVIFAGIGLYTVKRHAYSHVARLVFVGVALTFMAAMAVAFWQRQFAFPRSVFVIAPLFQVVALNLWRRLTLRLERHRHGRKKLLIVGDEEDAKRLLPKVLSLPAGWVEIACIHPPEATAEIFDTMSGVDAVMLTEKVAPEIKRGIIVHCFELGLEVFVVPDLYDILLKKSLSSKIGDTPIMEVPDILVSPVQMFFKHTCDFVFALAGLVLASPLFLLTGILIKATSPGPVFYTQERVGKHGRIFKMQKFRTMINNAEDLCGPVLADADDPRVTPLGRVLRSTRLDELPQLLNVLRGEMSLVGPRPERPIFVSRFLHGIPEYKYRHLIRPGITGLAQVRSKYATSVHDKLRYDLDYIVNYSLLLDMKILLETIPIILFKEAAEGWREPSDADTLFRDLSSSKPKTSSI